MVVSRWFVIPTAAISPPATRASARAARRGHDVGVDQPMVHPEVRRSEVARPADRLGRSRAIALDVPSRHQEHRAGLRLQRAQAANRLDLEGLNGRPRQKATGAEEREHLLLDRVVALPIRVDLDLGQELDRRRRELEQLSEGRDALVGDCPVARLETHPGEVGELQVADGSRAGGRTVERRIVEYDELAVRGHVEVELERVHAERQSLTEGEQAVLGPEGRAAAMGGHESRRAAGHRSRGDRERQQQRDEGDDTNARAHAGPRCRRLARSGRSLVMMSTPRSSILRMSSGSFTVQTPRARLAARAAATSRSSASVYSTPRSVTPAASAQSTVCSGRAPARATAPREARNVVRARGASALTRAITSGLNAMTVARAWSPARASAASTSSSSPS